MRVSILLFPLALVVAIFLSVFYIWPEIETIRENSGVIKQKEADLSDIKAKNASIMSMAASLDSNKSDEDLMQKYLPSNRREENIVDGINYIATNTNVSLVNIFLADVKEEKTITNVTARGFAVGGEEGVVKASYESDLEKINANISAVGRYEDLRSFVNQISAMELFNEVETIDISKGEEGEEGSSEILVAEIGVNFGNLPKVSVVGEKNYQAPIFMKSGLDFGVMGDLVEKVIKQKLPVLSVDQSGRGNPFLP